MKLDSVHLPHPQSNRRLSVASIGGGLLLLAAMVVDEVVSPAGAVVKVVPSEAFV